jgi:hypothetical protein
MATTPQQDDLYKRLAQTVARRRPGQQPSAGVNLDALIGTSPAPTSFQPMAPNPPREPDWNLGQGFIDLISSGTYLTAGMGRKFGENVQAASQGDLGGVADMFNPFSALGAGFSGISDRRTWGDNLKDWGVDEDKSPWLGLALDIAVDPIWLIPGGAIAAGIKGTYQGAKFASTATKTGVQLTKPSVEAARDLTRSANEVRIAAGKKPTTTQELVGGFNKEGKVVGDARFGEVLEGSGRSLGALSPQGLSNLVQGVKLGNAENYANWSTLRTLTKQAKAEAKAAKAAGVISTDPIKLSPNEVISRDALADALPRAENIADDAATLSERPADLIESVAKTAQEAQEPLVKLEQIIPGSADPRNIDSGVVAGEAVKGYSGMVAKAFVDLRDRVLNESRLISSPIAGTRAYTPEQVAQVEAAYSRAAGIKNLDPMNKVSRGVIAELDEMTKLFDAGDFTELGLKLGKLEQNLVTQGRVPKDLSNQVGAVVRDVFDQPKDITDLLEAALKAEGRPLADVPPFRATTWSSPRNKYGKPAFSMQKLERYFPGDELLADPTKLGIAMGTTPVKQIRAYRKVGETKEQAVARQQAQIWENFRARHHDELVAIRAQERSDWLAQNSVPGSELFIRLADGSYLGKGLMPDGFPVQAITVHNGRPVTTVGAMLDEIIKAGGQVPEILARWLRDNIKSARTAAVKTGVKTPRGPMSVADEDAIAEKLWKQHKFINSKADARLVAKLGPKGVAELARKPKRQFYVEGPVDRATGLPAASLGGPNTAPEAALDLGKFIAGAGRENIGDSILNQGRASIGAMTDAINRGEMFTEPAQVAVFASIMRDLGIKTADTATPQQILAQFASEAAPRYEEIARRLRQAANVDSMGPALERVFNTSAAERLSLVKAADKMDPAKVQAELRTLADDVAEAVDRTCSANAGAPANRQVNLLDEIIGGISG